MQANESKYSNSMPMHVLYILTSIWEMLFQRFLCKKKLKKERYSKKIESKFRKKNIFYCTKCWSRIRGFESHYLFRPANGVRSTARWSKYTTKKHIMTSVQKVHSTQMLVEIYNLHGCLPPWI